MVVDPCTASGFHSHIRRAVRALAMQNRFTRPSYLVVPISKIHEYRVLYSLQMMTWDLFIYCPPQARKNCKYSLDINRKTRIPNTNCNQVYGTFNLI